MNFIIRTFALPLHALVNIIPNENQNKKTDLYPIYALFYYAYTKGQKAKGRKETENWNNSSFNIENFISVVGKLYFMLIRILHLIVIKT